MSKYAEFIAGLQRNVFLNPFDYTKNEIDIYELVDIIFSNTTSSYKQTDLLFENCEFLFIWANALYLFKEAPNDEQNMFMMAELFTAGVTDSEEESDLDRLFEMSRKRRSDCVAIKKYDDFKACSVGIRNVVIKSCMGRIAPIGCDSTAVDMLSNIPIDTGISKYVDSFISNSQRQLSEKTCGETEYNLILLIFDYMYQQKAQDERTHEQVLSILDDVYSIFDTISKSNPTNSYLTSFNRFCGSEKSEQIKAIANLKKRLDFWKEFK